MTERRRSIAGFITAFTSLFAPRRSYQSRDTSKQAWESQVLRALSSPTQNAWGPESEPERDRLENLTGWWGNKELSQEERLYLAFLYAGDALEEETDLSCHLRKNVALHLKASACYREALEVYECIEPHYRKGAGTNCLSVPRVRGRELSHVDDNMRECLLALGKHEQAIRISDSWGFYTASASAAFLAGKLSDAIQYLAKVPYQPISEWDGMKLMSHEREWPSGGKTEIDLCVFAVAVGDQESKTAMSILGKMGAPSQYIDTAVGQVRAKVEAKRVELESFCTPNHNRRSGAARGLTEVIQAGSTTRAMGVYRYAMDWDEHLANAGQQLRHFMNAGDPRHLKAYRRVVLGSGMKSMSEALVRQSCEVIEHGPKSGTPAALGRGSSKHLLALYDALPLVPEHPGRTRFKMLLECGHSIDARCIVDFDRDFRAIESHLRGAGKLREARSKLKLLGAPRSAPRFSMHYLHKRREWVFAVLEDWLSGDGSHLVESFLDAWKSRTLVYWHKEYGFAPYTGRKTCPSLTLQFSALAEAATVWLRAEWSKRMKAVRWKSQELCGRIISDHWPTREILKEYSAPWLGSQRYDFYIAEEKVAIEYNGLQHYEPVEIFGGDAGFKATQIRDRRKELLSSCAGVDLYVVRHDEDIAEAVARIRRDVVSKQSGSRPPNPI